MFDFDKLINRSETGSLKIDKYRKSGVLPMWVADMDFAAPEPIIEAVKNRADHGVFGYTIVQDKLKNLIVERMWDLYRWRIKSNWIVFSAGLVSGLACAVRGICQPGQSVSMFTPIYPPFLGVPEINHCSLNKVPLINNNEYYEIDFDRFATSIDGNSGMLMFCNPHNPAGRAHTSEELEKLAQICLENKLPIVSDEIHCEIMLDGNKHIPIASLNPEIEDSSITLMSASKTFNVAGLMTGFAIIPNQEMRQKYSWVVDKISSHPNTLGYEATYAAFKYCEPWRMELLDYLTANRDYAVAEINKMPGLKCTNPQATYLCWIDCRELGVDNPISYFEDKGVGFSDGVAFDKPGYVRLNFGCPRSMLQEAIEKMK